MPILDVQSCQVSDGRNHSVKNTLPPDHLDLACQILNPKQIVRSCVQYGTSGWGMIVLECNKNNEENTTGDANQLVEIQG